MAEFNRCLAATLDAYRDALIFGPDTRQTMAALAMVYAATDKAVVSGEPTAEYDTMIDALNWLLINTPYDE